jgi:selenocysteine lyase/cysteine desulfurase
VIAGMVLCLSLFYTEVFAQGKPTKTEMQQPNLDGLVEVSFRIDASGKIQIVHINSTSPQLTEYVVNKLSKINLSNDTAPDGKVITYRFVFKKQA